MKRILICIAVLLLAAQALAQGKFILDYKGMPFGKDMTEAQHMKKDRQQGDLVFYTRYGDDRTFQGVQLKEQFYGYVGNKLALVMLSAQGPSSYNALKAYYDANYGAPRQPKVNVKQFVYNAGDVEVLLSYNDDSKILEVSYMYTPIMRGLLIKK